jgi:DNA-binding GntR family transcriptional regulator
MTHDEDEDPDEPHASGARQAGSRDVRARSGARRPRYQQIADVLRDEIRRGEHEVGRFLASEAALMKRFRVSRHTVREALRVLDELGLIRRRRGAGSVVRNAEITRHFDQALHSIADLLQYDESSDFHARYTDRLVAGQELAGWLQTRIGTECILLHGVRIGRRTRRPIASVNVYRRASWHGLPSGHARQEDAIRALLEDQFLARVGRVEQTLSAIAMPAEAAAETETPEGTPALRSLRRYFDARDRLMLAVISIHPGGAYSYRTEYRRSDIAQAE